VSRFLLGFAATLVTLPDALAARWRAEGSFEQREVRTMRLLGAVVLCWVIAADGACAQATGLPTFFAPTRAFASSEAGATLSRPGGDATGIELRLGAALNRTDFAFRLGFLDTGAAADGNWAAGIEARFPAIGRSQSFPLDGSFIMGVGRVFASAGVPVGLSIGRNLVLGSGALEITPYAQPTVVITDDTLVVLGLGVDLTIRGIPDLRINWGAGDIDGFSVSLYWRR
jgi:hypothetical protein